MREIFNTTEIEIVPRVKPEVDSAVLASIDPAFLEDSFVYVHCNFFSEQSGSLIRIWPTTYLVDAHSGSKSGLVHAENISLAPMWTPIPQGAYSFLLVFSSLPKSCSVFHLIEEISQPGGFEVRNIRRNLSDVYHVDF